MKKFLLFVIVSLMVVSCSKKKEVYITGKITGGSPLERIEFIEASGAATLPIANIGVSGNGSFSDTLEIPKSGMYAFSYGGKMNFIYLKAGEKVNISANANTFPQQFTVTGDAKKNNDFLKAAQEEENKAFSKLTQEVVKEDDAKFTGTLEKLRTDLDKKLEEKAKSYDADSEVLKWKKNELDITLLMIAFQYQQLHGQMANIPNYKPSKIFEDFKKKLSEKGDELVKDMPTYRNYLINTMSEDFQKYNAKNTNPNLTTTESFINYLKTRKDISQSTKDYLIAFVATQLDLRPQNDKSKQLMKALDANITNSEIKEQLHVVEKAMYGLPVGAEAPKVDFVDASGKKVSSSSFNGKPTLYMFYASWNPYIAEGLMPLVKQLNGYYKGKVNYVFVDMDDNMDQFKKTSSALLANLEGSKVYAKKGLNSDVAKQFGIYGFKLPSFLVVDKDGKIASKVTGNITDTELKNTLDKLSGITAPAIVPPAAPQPIPVPMPQPQPAPQSQGGH